MQLLTILTPSTKVADLASWAMLHLWAGAERSQEFVAPLLHTKVPIEYMGSIEVGIGSRHCKLLRCCTPR